MRGMPASRRAFLRTLASVGVVALARRPRLAAQGSARTGAPHRIDVHGHFSSPGFIATITARKTGQVPLMNWSVATCLEHMDQDGVATSIVSTSEPGVWFGDNSAARTLARECNEYAARLIADHPGRFGMFATLPMPDVDGTLREIAYAFDTLRADGVCVMSSYQAKYLGDPMFAPVVDELNRRKAVVYTHPVRAESMVNLLPEGRALGITLASETTFAIASVLFSGTATRCPDIRFIWSHGGGTMPYITGRFNPGNSPEMAQRLPRGVIHEIQRMYYDTAQAFNEYTLPTFTTLVPHDHILFGTDYPFARAETVAKGLAASGLTADEIRAIERDNALALLPRLAAR